MENPIKSYDALLERVWTDEDFKNRFITDPKVVLTQIGATIPDSVKVEVHEDTPNLKHFVLPLKSPVGEAQPNTLLAAVMQRASNDENYKAKLLENPKAAIEEATGEAVPDELTVRVHADNPTLKHLVIPIKPPAEELSESELEMVAGGTALPISNKWLTNLGGGIKFPPSYAGFMPVNNWLTRGLSSF